MPCYAVSDVSYTTRGTRINIPGGLPTCGHCQHQPLGVSQGGGGPGRVVRLVTQGAGAGEAELDAGEVHVDTVEHVLDPEGFC